MALTADPADLVGRVRRDVGRNLSRARNGVKYVTGIDRPKVGTTPKSTVWRRDKAQLWRYAGEEPAGGGTAPPVTDGTPVLIVMSLISRSYILDLYPGAMCIPTGLVLWHRLGAHFGLGKVRRQFSIPVAYSCFAGLMIVGILMTLYGGE